MAKFKYNLLFIFTSSKLSRGIYLETVMSLQCNHVINAPKHICICITEEYKNTCTRFNLIMGITLCKIVCERKKRPKCGWLEVRTKPYQNK